MPRQHADAVLDPEHELWGPRHVPNAAARCRACLERVFEMRKASARSTEFADRPEESGHSDDSEKRRLTRDGMWTLALNALSKFQSLALLVGGYEVGGYAGIGVVATAVGASYLASSSGDFGLSNEIYRAVARSPNRATVALAVKTMVYRLPIAVVLAPITFRLTAGTHSHASWALYGGMAIFAASLVTSTELAATIGGLGNFSAPTQMIGTSRFVSAVGALVLVGITHSAASILFSFVVGEVVGGALCVACLRRHSYPPNAVSTPERISRQHLWLGGASILNVLTNQSDTLLVAALISPTQLGIFGVASQLQNGVATLALSPATPITVRAAKASLKVDAHVIL